MRWNMVVLRESPWYQEILSEGEVKGRQEEGASLVIRLLNCQVGMVSEEMRGRVQSLSISQLEALLDFTDMTDLDGWMRSQNID
jgi:predicted transposase YdaD